MTPDFVSVAPYLTADKALAQLGRVAEEAETIYYVYVTDPAKGGACLACCRCANWCSRRAGSWSPN